MAKSVTYSLAERRDLKNFESGNKLFYAQAQARGVMDIREISDRIQRECTVTRSDIMAVLVALSGVVCDGLKSGEIVRLGDLGSLQISLSSEGVKDEKDFTSANITKARIRFRVGQDLTEALSGLEYTKVAKKQKTGTQTA